MISVSVRDYIGRSFLAYRKCLLYSTVTYNGGLDPLVANDFNFI